MGVRSDAGLPYSEALGPNIKPEPQSQSHGLPPAGISRQPFGRGKKRVRLFVQFAGKRDLQYLKDFPTEPFELLVSNLKQASAGIVPLGFDVSQKGNLLIDFPKHTSREALESNLDLIRNTLNIDQDIPVILVINQSSVCIAGVPTRLRPDGLVFSEAELVESLLKNPAIAALTITSQPRWLHKPENDIPPRSSVVFRFDDPEGAIAESLCRTPIYVFGALKCSHNLQRATYTRAQAEDQPFAGNDTPIRTIVNTLASFDQVQQIKCTAWNALKGGSASGGTVGFKGVARSGYEAGYQCALRIFSRIGELKKTVNPALGDLKIELLFNGMLGQGREAVYRALMTQDGEHVRNLVCRVTDTSRIRVGGTRPKKRRIL
ncbi:hypothetical protein BN14_07442 [Rhizoctonia solani AG-1 IB]|uniref:Uncharacterized protein n=1 Tax=Thanatephorus cucumeris (strain AG1-IB / isolate 7/3/14) TaxID=1108050 RepID=M5CBZ6_THACB|nr:hypothetical protein BN14_07442 [Rhizoctonia solani AG-1 IB]